MSKVIFREDILTERWGLSFGEMKDLQALLIYYGWLQADESMARDCADSCQWEEEAHG